MSEPNYKEKLKIEFIDPFDKGKKIKHISEPIDEVSKQEDLVVAGLDKKRRINKTQLSSAFSAIRNESKGKPTNKSTDEDFEKIYKYLYSVWEIKDEKFVLKNIKKLPIPKKEQVFSSFPEQDFLAEIKEGDELCILDTFYQRLLDEDTYSDKFKFKYWINEYQLKLKILVLAPEGKAISIRYHDKIAEKHTDFIRKCLTGLKNLFVLQEKYPENVEVRVIDTMPGVNLYLLPNMAYYGVFLTTDISNNTSFTKVGPETHMSYQQMKQHFQNLWEAKTTKKLSEALLEKSENVINQRQNRNELKGEWNIFLSDDRFQKPENKTKVGYISRFKLVVGETQKNSKTPIELQYTDALGNIKTVTHHALYERTGKLDFYHFLFTDYLTFSFYLYVKDDSNSTDSNPILSASYTMIYEKEIIGGRALLKKGSEKAISINPLIDTEIPFDDDILKIFALKEKNLFSTKGFGIWYKERINERDLNKYAGTYEIFMYGRDRDTGRKGIEHNILKIGKFGHVEYRYPTDNLAFGVAYNSGENIYITLFDTKNPRKVFYFILCIKGSKSPIFTGVSLGVSSRKFPTGRRLIGKPSNEKFEEFEINRIFNHTEEYQQLPDEFKALLSGRVNNLIGFLHKLDIFSIENLRKEIEHEKAISIAEILKKTAIYHLLQNENKEALRYLKMARNHGFSDFENFKNTVKDLVAKMNSKDNDLDIFVESFFDSQGYKDLINLI